MALLDELLIRIVADSSGVNRSVDESRKKSDDLTDSLKDTEHQAKSTGEAMAGFAAKALGALTAALGVAETFSKVTERANMIAELQRTSDALGVAIEDLDAFGKAAERAGGDAQGARDSLTDMSEALGEALSDKESGRAKAFQALGIAITDTNGKAKDGLTGILDLASAVEGLDKSAAVFKIKELGITDNRTVEMILKGRKELERMLAVQKAQGVVTKEAAERAAKFNDALYALRGMLSNASNSFLDSLIPALTKGVEWLTKIVEYASDHKDFIVGFFIAIGAVVAGIYLPAMIAAAAATLAATWPLIAIGALIAAVGVAFGLLYDDISNFIDGNDSFIGQVFEKYPAVQQVVMALIDIFKALWDILVTGAEQVASFISIGFQQIIAGISAFINFLPEAIAGVSGFVDSAISAFRMMADVVSSIFATIVDTVKKSISFVTDSVAKVKSAAGSVAGFLGIGRGDEGKPASDQPVKPRGALPSGSGQGPEDVPRVESTSPPSPFERGRSDSTSLVNPAAGIKAANQQIAAASNTPANAVTSSSISNSTQNRTSNVDVGQITIQTQATDAQGISRDLSSELGGQLKNLEHESSTGVAR